MARLTLCCKRRPEKGSPSPMPQHGRSFLELVRVSPDSMSQSQHLRTLTSSSSQKANKNLTFLIVTKTHNHVHLLPGS